MVFLLVVAFYRELKLDVIPQYIEHLIEYQCPRVFGKYMQRGWPDPLAKQVQSKRLSNCTVRTHESDSQNLVSVTGSAGEGVQLTIDERKKVAEAWIKEGRAKYVCRVFSGAGLSMQQMGSSLLSRSCLYLSSAHEAGV